MSRVNDQHERLVVPWTNLTNEQLASSMREVRKEEVMLDVVMLSPDES